MKEEENTAKILIIPDADDFIKVMEEIQAQYLAQQEGAFKNEK